MKDDSGSEPTKGQTFDTLRSDLRQAKVRP